MPTDIDFTGPIWSEGESAQFIALGRMYTPRREELLETFLDLIPFEPDASFTGIELGTGAGWLSEGILRRFYKAHMIGLDGSEAMRATTSRLLAPFGPRAEVMPFRLESQEWRDSLPALLHLVVSSLVVHHLDGEGKQQLFHDLYAKLSPGGALLLCDVVESASEQGRIQMARSWDAEVLRNSNELNENRTGYDQFVSDEWNIYAFPVAADDIDHPSPLTDQLTWLANAGFTGIDAWWVRAGHALFGGYKPD